jgi:hypothetical protein
MRLMDSIIQRFGNPHRQLAEIEEEVVRDARDVALRLVTPSVVTPMSPAEARGYVRARARNLVKQRTIQALGRRTLYVTDVQRDCLMSVTLERVITRVLNQVEYGQGMTEVAQPRAA